jgi:phytol kinase
MNPYLGVATVLLVTAFLFTLVGVLKYRFAMSREWTRKLIHIGVGLIALTFPWTLRDQWLVLAVSAAGTIALFLARKIHGLSTQLHSILGVRRPSFGELLFPATVGLLYVIARGDQVLYVIPLLVLTFADAAAAIIGMHYGAFQYSTEEGWKSAEGSFVFFLVAFFSTHIPLLVLTQVGRTETLLISFLAAFIAMLVEAVSTKGFDNILVPLVTLLVVQSSLGRGIAELVVQAVVACGMLAIVLLTRNRNTLSGSALMGIVLVGFLCWTFGGWRWLLPPLIVFLANNALHVDAGGRPVTAHFDVVRRVSEAGLVWLFAAAMLHRDELILPFVAAFCAQLAMLAMRQLRVMAPSSRGISIATVSVLGAWALLYFPLLWVGVLRGDTIQTGLALLAVTLLASVVFYRKLMRISPEVDQPRPWRTQSWCGVLASLAILMPLYLL